MAALVVAIVLLCVVRPASYSGTWKEKRKIAAYWIALRCCRFDFCPRSFRNRNGLSALHVQFCSGWAWTERCLGKIFGGIIAIG